MNPLDIYYRAFKEYRKETKDNKSCQRERKTIRKGSDELDKFHIVKFLCTIEEDWVRAIEEGLIHVEKALAEERQFIRTNGEVVPIEKAKKVSKHTVEHLARHSNLITHIPKKKGDTLIPDSLYIVERLSDYAVYENRFLYMMLCYLRDFIQLRIDKIHELRMSYKAEYYQKNEIKGKKRNLEFEVKFYEDRTDNPYPLYDERSAALIRRIEDIQQLVISYLNHPIMHEVSKTPMVKPPIVKTNVLKMNNNFKGALALYDYVANYTGPGFEAEEVVRDFVPLNEELADEFSELGMITSFMTYAYGNDLNKILEEEYQEEERKRIADEVKKLEEQIQRLKKRIDEEGISPFEYLVLLEKRNQMLLKDSEALMGLRKEIKDLNQKIQMLELEKNDLSRRIEDLEKTIQDKILEIQKLNEKFLEDMAELRHQHELDIMNRQTEHLRELEEEKNHISDKLHELSLEYEAKLRQAKQELDTAYTVRNNEKQQMELEISNIKVELEHMEIQKNTLEGIYKEKLETATQKYHEELDALNSTNRFLSAEYHALRQKNGLITKADDYTSKERFKEIEAEFEEFYKFFKNQWKDTKKQIRKKLLWAMKEKEEDLETQKQQVKEEKPEIKEKLEIEEIEQKLETEEKLEKEEVEENKDSEQ